MTTIDNHEIENTQVRCLQQFSVWDAPFEANGLKITSKKSHYCLCPNYPTPLLIVYVNLEQRKDLTEQRTSNVFLEKSKTTTTTTLHITGLRATEQTSQNQWTHHNSYI